MYPLITHKQNFRLLSKGNGILMAIVFALFSKDASAQTSKSDTMSMTILQALDFAITNNTSVKNAYADLAIANQTVKEVTAIGIPQVRGSFSFTDALAKQVFVFPLNGPGSPPTPIRVGNKYTSVASLNVNWLMLDGTYFLGLQSAKKFTDLSKKIASKTETDVKIDVAKSYLMCIITKENINLINNTYNTLYQTYEQVVALNKEGFADSLEVDRLKLQLNNLSINRQKMQDQYEILLGLLKNKIGMDQEIPLKLVDDVNTINNRLLDVDTTAKVNLTARTDYQVLQQQLVLNKLNVKRYQFGKYPNLVGAFTYQQSNFGEESIDYSRKNWYDNYFYALQLNIPIFSGFSNNAKIQTAKIEQIKTENTIRNVENLITLEVNQNRLKYLRALDMVNQQLENLQLATKILNITTIKYKEGIGSNLELITANQDLKNSQTNYLNAIYDLLVAKIDYLVSIGQPIKL